MDEIMSYLRVFNHHILHTLAVNFHVMAGAEGDEVLRDVVTARALGLDVVADHLTEAGPSASARHVVVGV